MAGRGLMLAMPGIAGVELAGIDWLLRHQNQKAAELAAIDWLLRYRNQKVVEPPELAAIDSDWLLRHQNQ